MTYIKVLFLGIAALLLIAGVIWYEVIVWRECLTDHSWWYCLRIIIR